MEQKDIDSQTANRVLLTILCIIIGALIVILLIKPDFFKDLFTKTEYPTELSKNNKDFGGGVKDKDGKITTKDGIVYKSDGKYLTIYKTNRKITVSPQGYLYHSYGREDRKSLIKKFVYDMKKAECAVTKFNTYLCRVTYEVDGFLYENELRKKHYLALPGFTKTGTVYFDKILVSNDLVKDINGNNIIKESFKPIFHHPSPVCFTPASNSTTYELGLNDDFTEPKDGWFELELRDEPKKDTKTRYKEKDEFTQNLQPKDC